MIVTCTKNKYGRKRDYLFSAVTVIFVKLLAKKKKV